MILPSPLGDRVGYFNHDRFRGYVSVHFCSGLQAPCLRFAVTVTDHHARLGTQLLAPLYCGRHLRRLYLMRLQGATPNHSGLHVSIAIKQKGGAYRLPDPSCIRRSDG